MLHLWVINVPQNSDLCFKEKDGIFVPCAEWPGSERVKLIVVIFSRFCEDFFLIQYLVQESSMVSFCHGRWEVKHSQEVKLSQFCAYFVVVVAFCGGLEYFNWRPNSILP